MKTSISSEALSHLGAEKITNLLNLTNRQTYGRTDISIYRVASLIKRITTYKSEAK